MDVTSWPSLVYESQLAYLTLIGIRKRRWNFQIHGSLISERKNSSQWVSMIEAYREMVLRAGGRQWQGVTAAACVQIPGERGGLCIPGFPAQTRNHQEIYPDYL